jgi:hypothetical protein
MSRRKDPIDQMADDIGCMIVGLLWVAAVAVFAAIFKATQVSPENQLLKLQPGYGWRWQIEPLDCAHCGAVNESYRKHCYQCGTILTRPETEASPQTTAAPHNEVLTAVVVIGIAIVIILIVMAFAGQTP